MKSIGERLRKAREARGLTQSAVAKAAGVSRPTVAQWEASVHEPGRDRFVLIADLLGGDPEWYEREAGNAPPDLLEPRERKPSAEAIKREQAFLKDWRQLTDAEQAQIHLQAQGLNALKRIKP